jgi:hypothetical protein
VAGDAADPLLELQPAANRTPATSTQIHHDRCTFHYAFRIRRHLAPQTLPFAKQTKPARSPTVVRG